MFGVPGDARLERVDRKRGARDYPKARPTLERKDGRQKRAALGLVRADQQQRPLAIALAADRRRIAREQRQGVTRRFCDQNTPSKVVHLPADCFKPRHLSRQAHLSQVPESAGASP